MHFLISIDWLEHFQELQIGSVLILKKSVQEKISESIATLYAEHYNVLQHITDPALHQFRLKGKRKITYATSVLDYTRQYLSSLWPLTLHVQSI